MITVNFSVSAETEKKFRESFARRDAESMTKLLLEALMPALRELLSQLSSPLSDEEFEAVADDLANLVASYLEPSPPVLSDYAFSRESIYSENP